MYKINSLFLSQSYKDSWDDYVRSLKSPNFLCWDFVVITASNSFQAEGFEKQIAIRQDANLLPTSTKYIVIPDRDGKRVGSGGATLEVIKHIANITGSSNFNGSRILVIHSGGDSKRVPQYSALGKLFSPVPHMLANGRPSTLFDEFMIIMSGVPSRIKEGMLVLSGDVLLLFNPLQLDFNNTGASAISFKEDVETGKNHGVFLNGEDGYVKSFLHKQSVDTLKSIKAVNDKNCVDIDTGAIIFSTSIISSLYSLIDTDDKYNKYVNAKVRLSLYGDFLYPLASTSSLDQFYNEKPEGEMCDELLLARKEV